MADQHDATPAAAKLAKDRGVNVDDVEGSGLDGRVTKDDVEHAPGPVTPAAAKLAKDRGVDVADVKGSGAHGRVTKDDVEHAPAAPSPKPLVESPATDPLDAPPASSPSADLAEADRIIRELREELSRCDQARRVLTNDLEIATAALDAALADNRASVENELRLEVSVLQGQVNAAKNALS